MSALMMKEILSMLNSDGGNVKKLVPIKNIHKEVQIFSETTEIDIFIHI